MAVFPTLIQDWYRQNKRNLPWREDKNPYFIWLSEIMLQQTRVDQAKNYFLAFRKKFPTVSHLANAKEDEVLNMWQGLGYYSRARNLHASAKIIRDEYSGVFPTSFKSIKELKGIGDYTASAISSIAYNSPHAVVDGNVYRVLSRYYNIETPIDSTEGIKYFKALAQELLDTSKPGNYNQALMEFGALMCVPKNPNCEACPLNSSCEGFAKNTQLELPVKSKKTKVRKRFIDYFVLTDGTSVLIKKRGDKDIWQGLYDFPLLENFDKPLPVDNHLEKYKAKNYYLDASLKHILSHQKLEVNFWIVEVDPKSEPGYEVCQLKDLQSFPLPQLLVKYLKSSPFFSEL